MKSAVNGQYTFRDDQDESTIMTTQIVRRSNRKVIVVGLAVLVIIALSAWRFTGGHFDVPFVRKQQGWTIGIYYGESPTHFFPPPGVGNPVLTARDVTDVQAQFVADPFMISENSTWYMFFEVKNAATQQGDIGLATSPDALHWTYRQIVLDEPFHLSYPYVFKWDGRLYLLPESAQGSAVRLYEAVQFPTQWRFVTNLISNVNFVDPSVFRYNDKWWLFMSTPDHSTLSVYFADDLMGPWLPHQRNPLLSGTLDGARPGGRLVVNGGRIYRYAQIDTPTYGYGLRAFEVLDLTPTTYREVEVKSFTTLKATGHGWNGNGMHTIDPHRLDDGRWIACVDGTGLVIKFGR